ncbi:MAG: carboxynorspermidine decarboxylase [Thermodesulfobacteriota bacterium]
MKTLSMTFDPYSVPSPCYVVDEALIRQNAELLASVSELSGCRVLLALKGFATFSLFPLLREYLSGVSASSLHEARLGREEFGGEVHLCAPAFRPDEFEALCGLCDHIVFNSFSQWRLFREAALSRNIVCGIRVNPEHREVETAIYDPCGPCSRLGVTEKSFEPEELAGITGLHFHNLCEKNADSLARTLPVFEKRFGRFLPGLSWVNFGGGHHITRPGYDVELLVRLVSDFRKRYGLTVYLEPGEAIALNTGVLVATVLDIVKNDMDIALLDTSAAAHMPDVLEMPYRPEITGAGKPGELACTFRLAGPTCLAGDVIGDYSFAEPLRPGDRLVFHDMAHYTMVKNNTFNGINLPSIAIREETGAVKVVKTFGYEDFRSRLS